MWRATGRLPKLQRTVFLLRYVDELKVPEIAALTGLPEAVLRATYTARWHRCENT